jgi:hypothetical protein
MAYQRGPTSAQGPEAPRAEMSCNVDFSIYYSIFIYFHTKIALVNEDKILKHLTAQLFIVKYCTVTSLICIFAEHAGMGDCDVTDHTMQIMHT